MWNIMIMPIFEQNALLIWKICKQKQQCLLEDIYFDACICPLCFFSFFSYTTEHLFPSPSSPLIRILNLESNLRIKCQLFINNQTCWDALWDMRACRLFLGSKQQKLTDVGVAVQVTFNDPTPHRMLSVFSLIDKVYRQGKESYYPAFYLFVMYLK